MQYITTTELRTESSKLVKSLKKGGSFRLIHRSKVVGDISPLSEPKTINAEKLQAKIDNLDLPRLTPKEIDRRYRIAMMKKHGQGLS